MQTATRVLSLALGVLLITDGAPAIAPSLVYSHDGLTVFTFDLGEPSQLGAAVLVLAIEVEESRPATTGMADIRFVAGLGNAPSEALSPELLSSRHYVAAAQGTAKIDVSRYLKGDPAATAWVAVRSASSATFLAASVGQTATLEMLRLPARSSAKRLNSGSAGQQGTAAPEVSGGHIQNAVAAPNPFNPRTSIAFSISTKDDVTIGIYTSSGSRVWTMTLAGLLPGRHEVQWNGIDHHGKSLASGVYYAVIRGLAWRESLKLALLR